MADELIPCQGAPDGKPCGRSYTRADMSDGKGDFIGWCIHCDMGKEPGDLTGGTISRFVVVNSAGFMHVIATPNEATARYKANSLGGKLYRAQFKIEHMEEVK